MLNNQVNKCEVCNVQLNDYDGLVNHYFDSNHNQNDLILKVQNSQIRELLGLSPLPIPQNKLEKETKYILHPVEIENKEIIKNEAFFEINNLNQLDLDKNKVGNDNYENNRNLNAQRYKKNNFIQSPDVVKRKCDICFIEVEPNYKQYALHVIQNHNPFVLDYIEDDFIRNFVINGGISGIKKCDICNINISLDVNDYIVHLQKTHSNLINKSLSKYVKDKYVVSVLLGKDIFKTSFFYSTCNICNEEIEGFEEFREHMLEHKNMKNAYQGFFGNHNPDQIKQNLIKNKNLQYKNENNFNHHDHHKKKKDYNPKELNNIFRQNDIDKCQNKLFCQKSKCNNIPEYQNLMKNDQNNNQNNKQDALQELTNFIKNFNQAFNEKNNSKSNIQDSKDEEIKLLKKQLALLESKIQTIESRNKKDLQERDKITNEIEIIMRHKNIKNSDIQQKLEKLELLEKRISENSKKLEEEKILRQSDFEKIKQDNKSKIKRNKLMMKALEEKFFSLNNKKEKNYQNKLHEYEKMMASIEKENLSLKENNYFKIPSQWQQQDSNLSLMELNNISDEYKKISTMFGNTYPQGKIQKITRIQNIELWKNFSYGKHQLKKKGNDTEKLLFHGTRSTDPKIIYSGIEEGFDMRYANTSGFFGVAIYFHENAIYSHDYRYSENGVNLMLVANVLIGDSINLTKIDQSLRLPPLKSESKQERYDSVNSEGRYMIYNNFRAYPAYLIQYI